MSARSAGLALKSAATAPVASAFVVAFIALVAFAGAAAPALLHSARTATVAEALDALSPATRDVSGATRGVPRAGRGASETALALDEAARQSWGAAFDAASATRDGFAEPLRAALGDPQVVVVSDPAVSIAAEPKPFNRVTLTFDPGYADRVELVEGRPPASREDDVFEVTISREASESLDWRIGDVRDVEFAADADAKLELVGVYEALDETDPHWTHVTTGVRPSAVIGPLGDVTLHATAYGAPEAVAAARELPDWFVTRVWLPLEVDEIDGATTRELARQLRGASGVQVPLGIVVVNRWPAGLALTSSAPSVLEGAAADADAMAGVVAFVAVGPFAVAIVVLALASRLVASRRVRVARLTAARGASDALLTSVLAVEGMILGVAGAVLGVVTAGALVGFEGAASLVVPFAVALTPVVALPWLTLSLSRRHARRDLGFAPRGRALRRGAIEIVVLVAAGLLTIIAVTGGAGVDPALLVLPLALSAAACVLALRCVPLLLTAIEARVPRTRGLVPLVGPARGRRDPSVRAAPVLAVVLGVAVVLFSLSFGATISEGVAAAARIEAGAELRLEAQYLSDRQLDDLAALEGIAEVAGLSGGSKIELEAGDRTVRATVYIADTAPLAAVQKASGAGTIPTPEGLDAPGDSIPAVVSPALAAELGGDRAQLGRWPVEVLATAPATAHPGPARTWLVVDGASVDRLGAVSANATTVLFALAPDADSASVASDVRALAGPTARVSTPASVAASIETDPALRTVYVALAAAAVFVAILLALAIGMALVLGAPGRARLMALLAALGYPRRRDVPFVLWEVGPALLVALPFGVGVGYALSYLALPQLGVGSFLDGVLEPSVQTGGWMPLAVVAGFALFSALAVVVAAVPASRLTASSAVRTPDEEG